MFIHDQTLTEINANLNESVSHSTLRPQDLIPAFLDVLINTPEYLQLKNFVPSYVLENDDDGWWDSEECSYFVNEELIDTISSYSPEGYYFGAHIGDGSDFGFWENEYDF